MGNAPTFTCELCKKTATEHRQSYDHIGICKLCREGIALLADDFTNIAMDHIRDFFSFDEENDEEDSIYSYIHDDMRAYLKEIRMQNAYSRELLRACKQGLAILSAQEKHSGEETTMMQQFLEVIAKAESA